jgi:hypothetical protein
MELRIPISIRRIVRLLVLVAVLLAALSFAVQMHKRFLAPPGTYTLKFAQLFDLKKEEGLSTWYTEVLLLLCSALFAAIYLSKRTGGDRYLRHWGGLSLVFLFLSVDEGASIHETLGRTGRTILGALGMRADGFVSYAWVVPAALLVVVFVLAYLRFFLNLPSRQRVLFFVAGAVYVGGALFLEMLSAFYIDLYGGQNNMTGPQIVTIHAITTAEETFEMLGVVVLIYALSSYLSGRVEAVRLHFGAPAPAEKAKRSGA